MLIDVDNILVDQAAAFRRWAGLFHLRLRMAGFLEPDPRVATALREARSVGWRVVVVTNAAPGSTGAGRGRTRVPPPP